MLNVVLELSQQKVSTVPRLRYVPDFVEISLVKDQQELVFILKALYSMGDTLGKVPNIAIVQLFGLVFAILIDRRDEDATFVYERPLGLGRLNG